MKLPHVSWLLLSSSLWNAAQTTPQSSSDARPDEDQSSAGTQDGRQLVADVREDNTESPPEGCQVSNPGAGLESEARLCMEQVNKILQSGNISSHFLAMERLEKVLEQTAVRETTFLSVGHLMAVLHKPCLQRGLQIWASDTQAKTDEQVTSCTLSVTLPSDLGLGLDNTIVFCKVTWPNTTQITPSHVVYQNTLVGLSVSNKKIFNLQVPVNITLNLTDTLQESQTPKCVFLNFSTKAFSSSGCRTVWRRGNSHVTCSCNHLTYFAVLLVPASLSAAHQRALSSISVIGCSLSLLGLLMAIIIFLTTRKLREDASMKVHINLAAALILLNVHFLPCQAGAALSSRSLCVYLALSLHYSLLATFSWMALESLHLYLLLVRVFNIYTRRYLLKLGLLGWSVPAAVVVLVVLIDPHAYGRVPLDASRPHSTEICYMVNSTLKMVTTLGVCALLFLFNGTMLAVTAHRVLGLHPRKEVGGGERGRAVRDVITLLGVATLLGVTWGLIFLSFGHLTTAGLYLFCTLNSLQGFFVFLWLVMSWRKSGHLRASRTPSGSG
nr:adhesion G-protein coupled receptor G5-like isoform X2 [Nerophis lumbriciformis]